MPPFDLRTDLDETLQLLPICGACSSFSTVDEAGKVEARVMEHCSARIRRMLTWQIIV